MKNRIARWPAVNFVHIVMVYVMFVCVGCSPPLFSPKSDDSWAVKQQELALKSRSLVLLRSYQHTEKCFSGYSDDDAKKESIHCISSIGGSAIQILRVFRWMIERDGNMRAALLMQWMGQMKYEGRLPPLKEIKDNMALLVENSRGDLDRRPYEIESAYDSLTRPGKKGNMALLIWYAPYDIEKIRYSTGFVFKYKKSETEYAVGIELLEDYQPFLDEKYPMGSVIFSGDKKAIRDAYKSHLNIRGIKILGREWDGEASVDVKDEECSDVALENILYGDKSPALAADENQIRP